MWRKVAIISTKHAVNALIVNTGLWALFPHTFNFHDMVGVYAFLKAAGVVIGTRELTVWLPHVLTWSQTQLSLNGNADSVAAGK